MSLLQPYNGPHSQQRQIDSFSIFECIFSNVSSVHWSIDIAAKWQRAKQHTNNRLANLHSSAKQTGRWTEAIILLAKTMLISDYFLGLEDPLEISSILHLVRPFIVMCDCLTIRMEFIVNCDKRASDATSMRPHNMFVSDGIVLVMGPHSIAWIPNVLSMASSSLLYGNHTSCGAGGTRNGRKPKSFNRRLNACGRSH